MENIMTTTLNTMKLSKDTFKILKNFSSLNSNLLVKKGNTINTITPAKNVVAVANVKEDFPVEFGIWDMNKFLGTISLFDDPEFSFGEKSVTVMGKNGGKVSYYYSEPSLLTTLTKEIKMPEVAIDFELSQNDFDDALKAASVLQLPDMCVRSNNEEGTIELVVLDKKSSTTNNYTITLGENSDGGTFQFYYKIENLKLLHGDYSVSLCKSVVSRFVHKEHDLVYYVALEMDSKYE
tara:strand:- start:5797 stop:6504 length:708 start_codon:yes stop_codon:yes gene_type:complete